MIRTAGAILLAEDNENDVLLTRLALERSRLANPLHIARDGEEAIAYLRGSNSFSDRELHPFPILLLLDLNMPKLNGFDVLIWLRQQPFQHHLLVAILTDSDSGPNMRRAYELGADSYLIKPANAEALLDLVRRLKANWAIELPECEVA
jgi:CheY-like chemotaxis protein